MSRKSTAPRQPAQPRVSLIVNTVNRAEFLDRLFDSFNHLDYDNFEVVVAHGPSKDDSREVLERWKDRVKIVDCPEENLSMSRNVGIRAASGEFVVFIDDDAHPDRADWLNRFIDPFLKDPDGRLACVGGSVRRRDTADLEFEDGAVSDYGVQAFLKRDMPQASIDGVRWIQSIPGGNNACRRAALYDIGGFDEFYTYYLDETDVAARLMRKGWRIIVDPVNAICHYKAQSARRKKTWDYNWHTVTRSDTYFCLKNGSDGLFTRMAKTLWKYHHKHFYREVGNAHKRGEITKSEFLRYRGRWLRGYLQGWFFGLTYPRRNYLKEDPNLPFKQFTKIRPKRKLCVGLLSQALPPDPHHGGIGRYTYDLAMALQHLGHEVHVFSRSEERLKRVGMRFYIHGISDREWAGREILPGFPVVSKNLAYSFALHRRVVELVQSGARLDFIESPNWDNEGIAFVLEPVLPLIVRVLSPMAQVAKIEEWEGNADTDLNIGGERALIASADHVCAPSYGVVETVKKSMGLDIQAALPFKRILLGPALKHYFPPPPRAAGDKTIRILFVGRLERRKGIQHLLEAAPSIMAAHPEVILDLVGNEFIRDLDGQTFKQKFLDLHRGAPWLDRVKFHGAVDGNTLQKFYRECDLFAAPSLYESFGLIYTEAMMYAKPVIGCMTGGVPEVVRDGVDGLLVPPGESEPLGAALEKLIADPDLRRRMGESGRKRLEEDLNSVRMAQRSIALYEEVVDKHAARYMGRIESLIGEEVRLDDYSQVAFPEGWVLLNDSEGAAHRVCWTQGVPAYIRSEHQTLELHFRRHSHSGIAKITVDGRAPVYEDLYEPASALPRPVVLTMGPGLHDIRIEVAAEKNPRSMGCEVWLAGITGYRGKRLSEADKIKQYLELIRKHNPVEGRRDVSPPGPGSTGGRKRQP